MSSLTIDVGSALAQDVSVTDDMLEIRLTDGRTVSTPIAWYPRLQHASAAERGDWRLIGDGGLAHDLAGPAYGVDVVALARAEEVLLTPVVQIPLVASGVVSGLCCAWHRSVRDSRLASEAIPTTTNDTTITRVLSRRCNRGERIRTSGLLVPNQAL